jgi:hypothetical protein
MISAIDVLRFISINPRRIWWKKIDILGDKDPVTVESLDFFASVYAKVGAEQYEGLLLLNAIFTYYIQLRLL